jgi:hypothetical protein
MQSKLLQFTGGDPENRLRNALSGQVVFHSPVRDYHGRADVAHILMTIGAVLDKIEVENQLVADRQVVTLISAVHGHRRMSGVLIETCHALGPVERATLLLRPLSALLDAITAMRAALERSPLPHALADPVVDPVDGTDPG